VNIPVSGLDDDGEPLAVVDTTTAKQLLKCKTTRFYQILEELETFRDGGKRLTTLRSIRARQKRLLAAAAATNIAT